MVITVDSIFFLLCLYSDNPLPTVIPDYHRATYGDMVQFKCLNNHVNWTFDRNPLPQNALVHQFSDHSLLTILNIRRGNRGLYICHTNLGQDKAMLMVDGKCVSLLFFFF